MRCFLLLVVALFVHGAVVAEDRRPTSSLSWRMTWPKAISGVMVRLASKPRGSIGWRKRARASPKRIVVPAFVPHHDLR